MVMKGDAKECKAGGTVSTNLKQCRTLFYSFWAMTGLLVGTFGFFGLHTILWVPRSLIERIKAMTEGH